MTAMVGRRQIWTGITLVLLSTAAPGGLETVALVATALLVAACVSRSLVVPALSAVALSVADPTARTTPAPTRLSPDAPGRPQQPRAPARGRLVVRPGRVVSDF